MKERREATKPGTDTRYTYAVGRVKALEAKLISGPAMAGLLEEETQAEVLRALGEFPDYAEIVAAGDREPEEILDEQLRRVYELVCELSLGSTVVKTLRLKYDFHNLKVLLKARLSKAEPQGLSTVGFLTMEQLARILDEKTIDSGVDPFAGEAMLEAVSAAEESGSPVEIEGILDRLYYRLFVKNLSVNPFLEEYARRTIDLINLRTLWRVKAMEWPEEKLTENLLPGGTVEVGFFVANFEGPMGDLIPKVPDDAYRKMLREALSAYQSRKALSSLRLDRLADDFLVEFIRETKKFCFGLEPLVGYIAGKENEVTRLRTILHGKEKALSSDSLREVLRTSYA